MAKQLPPSKVLNYSIHSSSGYSASYAPANIRLNCPADQASRWSSASNDQNQFLILEIGGSSGDSEKEQFALLESIGFGKFHKVHVCNLKEFKVYAGPTLDSLHLILHTGLNNDTVPESFPPDYSLSGLPDKLPFPVRFVKIVPLAAWGSNFNFSIWYIELRGWVDTANSVDSSSASNSLVRAAMDEYNRVKEEETTRLVLKFLRQHRHTAAFAALQIDVPVQLEAPAVTQLHTLISQNRLTEAEALLVDLYTQDPSVFDQFLQTSVPYEVHWTRLDDSSLAAISTISGNSAHALDENGDYRMMDAAPLKPSARGGHQMLWDPRSRQVFLFGGWDGKRDLADFWSFNPANRTWTLISMNTEKDGGPCARSCHKAALHSANGHIYILGRYIDPERRTSTTLDSPNLPCDFYRYTLADGTWMKLSGDVRAEGGPGCIYDHQMVIDEEEDCLWVFGGRLLSGTNEASVYSGLYRHDLRTSQWTLIQSDPGNTVDSAVTQATLPPMMIPSRIGHSMLFDPLERSLLLLSGQRYKDQLSDFYKYSIDRRCITQLWKSMQLCGGPEAGFTQRAAIDPGRREMYVFSSLIRTGSSAVVGVPPPELETGGSNLVDETCAFWCFNLQSDKWTRIPCSSPSRPPARFAHQLAYDPVTQVHFLFGGNPGSTVDPSARLDDLWAAHLKKSMTPAEVLRRCQYLIRKRIFESLLCTSDIPTALKFLQTDLSAVVNHANAQESAAFRCLSTRLFEKAHHSGGAEELFEEIVKYLPQHMQPPIKSL